MRATAATIALAILLTACGGDSDPEPGPSATTGDTTTTAVAVTTTTTAPAPMLNADHPMAALTCFDLRTAEGAITYGGDAPADALRGKDIDPGILSTDAVRRILDDYDVEALKQLLAECDAAGYDL